MYPSPKERADREHARAEAAEDEEDDSEFDPDIGIVHKDGQHSDDNSIEMDQMRTRGGYGNRNATVSMTPMKSPVYPQYPGGYPQQPGAAATAYTPRTTAFNRLGGR